MGANTAGPWSTHAPSCLVWGCRLVLSATSCFGEPRLITNKQSELRRLRFSTAAAVNALLVGPGSQKKLVTEEARSLQPPNDAPQAKKMLDLSFWLLGEKLRVTLGFPCCFATTPFRQVLRIFLVHSSWDNHMRLSPLLP